MCLNGFVIISSEIVLKEEKDNMLKKKQERRVFSLCKIESFCAIIVCFMNTVKA